MYHLILIFLVPDISSNTFAADKREFIGIAGIILYTTFFKDLQ